MRRQVNKSLRDEGEEPVKTSEFEAALAAFAAEQSASWLSGASRDTRRLDAAEHAILNDAVSPVLLDTLAVRRHRRWKSSKRDGGGQTWEPYLAYSPGWWDREVDDLFARLRPLQERAVSLMALPRAGQFLEAERVPAALRRLAGATALPADVMLVLEVPMGYLEDSPQLNFKRMTFGGDWPGRENETGVPGVHPLHSLLALTVRVQHATGCRQWEALGYLLCDEVPWVPAVEVQVDSVLRSIAIRVRHPEVPVDAVAAAYKDARSELGAHQRVLRKITTGWPAKVFEFVTEWEQSHPGRLRWLPIYAEFSTRYPAATYSNPVSLRETFYRERERRRQEAHARARA